MLKLMLVLVIMSLNLLVSQCHDKSKFPCINTEGCEWRTELLKGSCLELSQPECQSGKYNNCYWYYSFDGEEQCQGSNYTIFDGLCHETENILSQHINESSDKYFENLLINSGFQLIELNNEKIFKKDEIALSYRDLQVTTSGIKFINPEIIIDENNGTLTELKFDSISIGVSMKQIVRLLEGLIYEERMGNVDSFQLNFINGYMSQINNNKYEPVGIIELSLNTIDFTFNGYLNQQMLDNIDKRGILPSLNQIFNFNAEY